MISPQDVAFATAVAAIFGQIGSWPLISVFLAIILGPWLGMALFFVIMSRRHDKMVQMYEANVTLVHTTQKLAEGWQDVVVLSTQIMTKVLTAVESNLFCPLMRKDPEVKTRAEGHR